MSTQTDSPPILFINSGVQLICFPLDVDLQFSAEQAGSGWQHCQSRDNSANSEQSIVKYGYLQWQIHNDRLFLAVDTSIGTTEDGPPQYFSKASSLTSDVVIALTGLLDARGEPFEGLPLLEFTLRPATSDGGTDRHVHLVVDFGNSRTGGLLVEFRGDARQEPMMTPLRLVNRYHLDAWNEQGKWDTTNATWWFSSKSHWCTSPYLPAAVLDVVEYREQERGGIFGGRVEQVAVTVQKTPRTFEEFSQVRMGREADDLVGGMEIEGDIRTGVSSPKRYLWARNSSWLEGANWYMADPYDRKTGEDDNRHAAKLGGPLLAFIPQDDQADPPRGTFEKTPVAPRHAPRALMQAALYELLCQAFTYANSPAYQELTGDAGRRRLLASLTLTFPSGMISSEREQLKKQAEKAIEIFSQTIGRVQLLDSCDAQPSDRQFPQLKLSIDEASAVHLTYLWSESRKLGGKPSLWFSVMGKTPRDSPKEAGSPPASESASAETTSNESPDLFGTRPPSFSPSAPLPSATSPSTRSRPEARVACIDIGGGTSDLMIAAYQCVTDPGGDQIIGETLHRDGLARAGDQLVKRLLERIIVPHFCREIGIEKNHINFLIGSGGPSTRRIGRQRIQWMNRLFVPLAHAYLDVAVAEADAPNSSATETVISQSDPNLVAPDVVQSFQDTINKEWGPGKYNVKQTVEFPYSRTVFEQVVDEVFGDLIFEFCESIVEHKADVVLLAGLPSKLPYIRQLVETYLPLAKSRIIPMHRRYAGTWYPYQNPDNSNPGMIVDPKSTVVVGAAIEFCARHGKLPQFKFEMNDLAARASYYWGVMTESRIDAEKIVFEPRENGESTDRKKIRITGENLIFGRKRRARSDAQASPVYRLRALRGSNTLGEIDFHVTFERRLDSQNEEEIVVQSVDGTVDGQPAVLGTNVLFDWRTLADERYYLDTGGLDKIELT